MAELCGAVLMVAMAAVAMEVFAAAVTAEETVAAAELVMAG